MLPSGSCGYAVQKSLTPQVYDFIQSIQQPAQVGSQASQPHAAVAREERMIPDIVFQIEELERQLIQLSSKGAQSVHAADMSCWMQMRCCCWKADYSDNFNRTIPAHVTDTSYNAYAGGVNLMRHAKRSTNRDWRPAPKA